MKFPISIVIPLCCSAVLSCGQPAQKTGNQPGPDEQASSAQVVIAPGHALIIGEVMQIESATLDPPDVAGPCSRFPCVAKVRVVTVVGTGMAFPQPFIEGEVYRMKFAYTLHATQEALPDMTPALPGLREGEKFKAEIRGHESLAGDPAPRYVVFAYEMY